MKKIVFLTGAGISAESGIPTFRGAVDGLWENHNVAEVATAKAIKEHPEVVYEFINELRNKYKDCKPNSAHKAIAELEKDYDVTVITQNIDNLHEQAGSSRVIHLHGDLSKVRVIGTTAPDEIFFDYPEEGITPETTLRGMYVRPHIVLFGEDVPNFSKAVQIIGEADICVVIGTSLNVYPAAELIYYVNTSDLYYIDPNPAYTPDFPDIKIIKAVATKGMEEFIKILSNESNKTN